MNLSKKKMERIRETVMDHQRKPRNYLPPLKKEFRPPTPKSDNGGNGGGECCGELRQGIPLSGDPTICCEGHDQLTANFGETIGTHNLWHQGGDVWSTFSEDGLEDNPFVFECSGGSDEYDIVLDLTTNKITLEPREELNCDPVCISWGLDHDVFQCLGSNRFRVEHFSVPDGVVVPSCLCLAPVPLGTMQNCTGDYCEAGNAPSAWVVPGINIPNGTCGDSSCGFFRSGPHLLWPHATFPTACNWYLEQPLSGTCFNGYIQLVILGSPQFKIQVNYVGTPSGGATYELALEFPFDCTVSRTLALTSSVNGACQFESAPAEIEVTPIVGKLATSSGQCSNPCDA